MSTYTHTITPLEIACGVTLEAVAHQLPRGLFFDGGDAFMVAADASPAIAMSTARCAFSAPVEYSHSHNGCPVYRRA